METLARFFLAGFDGLSVQHLSLPDEEAELICLQALVSAVVVLAAWPNGAHGPADEVTAGRNRPTSPLPPSPPLSPSQQRPRPVS